MTINSILFFDVETGGTDPAVHPLIEVGAVLWSVTHRSITRCFSSLVRATSNEAESVNRIPAAQLADAPEPHVVRESLKRIASLADIAVAHNASFDVQWLPEVPALRPVVCSCHDIEWPTPGQSSPLDQPRSRPGKSLVALCLEHGVGVGSAHRAITDCLLLARLFERVAERHDLQTMLARAMRPKALFEVADKAFSEERNAQAKAAGFSWNAKARAWQRRMCPDDVAALPFATREAQP